MSDLFGEYLSMLFEILFISIIIVIIFNFVTDSSILDYLGNVI